MYYTQRTLSALPTPPLSVGCVVSGTQDGTRRQFELAYGLEATGHGRRCHVACRMPRSEGLSKAVFAKAFTLDYCASASTQDKTARDNPGRTCARCRSLGHPPPWPCSAYLTHGSLVGRVSSVGKHAAQEGSRPHTNVDMALGLFTRTATRLSSFVAVDGTRCVAGRSCLWLFLASYAAAISHRDPRRRPKVGWVPRGERGLAGSPEEKEVPQRHFSQAPTGWNE